MCRFENYSFFFLELHYKLKEWTYTSGGVSLSKNFELGTHEESLSTKELGVCSTPEAPDPGKIFLELGEFKRKANFFNDPDNTVKVTSPPTSQVPFGQKSFKNKCGFNVAASYQLSPSLTKLTMSYTDKIQSCEEEKPYQ